MVSRARTRIAVPYGFAVERDARTGRKGLRSAMAAAMRSAGAGGAAEGRAEAVSGNAPGGVTTVHRCRSGLIIRVPEQRRPMVSSAL
jgi:hypothetical protein